MRYLYACVRKHTKRSNSMDLHLTLMHERAV